jgi:hypothetical protein
MGNAIKVILTFSQRFWPEEQYDVVGVLLGVLLGCTGQYIQGQKHCSYLISGDWSAAAAATAEDLSSSVDHCRSPTSS